jgi:hypothetical protein
MDIAFHIPTWVFWVVGIPSGLIVLALAALGIAFMRCFGDGYRW